MTGTMEARVITIATVSFRIFIGYPTKGLAWKYMLFRSTAGYTVTRKSIINRGNCMILTIVIPVLNEEGSVEKVARGCLEASDYICEGTSVDRVNVVVVSDGSTDRSAEIARSIDGVHLVEFESNRGYGAAIQTGWAEYPADLLAFLDGDGTCDPRFFRDLIQQLDSEEADLVLGSRMGPDSHMPRTRRIGNWLFANLLGILSRQKVTDSASGMRVVRAESLPDMLPLPTGLHFTPSMSARAILGGLKIAEVPMTYSERVGRSKLSVVRDGVRFLETILSAALAIRPSRLLLPVVGLLLAGALLLSIWPIAHYLDHGSLLEGMMYRMLFIALLASTAVAVFCGTLLAEHIIAIGLMRYGVFQKRAPWWWSTSGLNTFVAIAAIGVVVGFVLVIPGWVAWLQTGSIQPEQLHWSRVVVASFSALTFIQLISTRILVGLMDDIEIRQSFLRDDQGQELSDRRGAPRRAMVTRGAIGAGAK